MAIFLSADDLRALVDPDGLRAAMRKALADLSAGRARNHPRRVQALANDGVATDANAALGFMTAETETRLGCKIAAVYPGNPRRYGLDAHQGAMLVLDRETGVPRGLLDASELTALRTAAVSAASCELLARENSETLGLIGCGRQAEEHLAALVFVRPIRRVLVHSRCSDGAERCVQRLRRRHRRMDVTFVDSASEALREADIVVSATSSREAHLEARDLRPGTHVCAIGACRPGSREWNFASATQALRVFVDSGAAAAAEADEIADVELAGEIGSCFEGELQGRASPDQITVFKSVGLGIEDLAAAEFFLARHRELA